MVKRSLATSALTRLRLRSASDGSRLLQGIQARAEVDIVGVVIEQRALDTIYPRALKVRLKECFARRRLRRDVVIADMRSAVYRI
jgi:hypothetical protein